MDFYNGMVARLGFFTNIVVSCALCLCLYVWGVSVSVYEWRGVEVLCYCYNSSFVANFFIGWDLVII